MGKKMALCELQSGWFYFMRGNTAAAVMITAAAFCFALIPVSKEMLSINSLPRICRAGITADAIPLYLRILRCV